MRRTIRDVLLTALTLGIAFVALMAGASLRIDILACALVLLWAIGYLAVPSDE